MRNLISFIRAVIALTVVVSLISCSRKQTMTPAPAPLPPPVVVNPPVTSIISLPSEWTLATPLMNGFPPGIEVYRRTTAFNSKAMNAYCVVFDPQNVSLEFKPVFSSTNKKVSDFFAQEPGTKYAVINGGFFGTNISYSLAQYNGIVQAINIKSLSRTYNGSTKTYYPTRGAFGISASGVPQISWVYHVGTGNGTLYAYPQPSPNDIAQAPQPQPGSGFPEGGGIWNVNSAIGGSPVLLKNNAINITDSEELIDVNNTTSRARSAIGYTANGLVVILAVEGNNSSGGAGLNLQEMAELMKSMGCTNALNLDGGGSTSMVINGQPTVKPSDAGGERPVITAIIIKKK